MKGKLLRKLEEIDFRTTEHDDRVCLKRKDWHFLIRVIGKIADSDITDYDLTLEEEIEELLKLHGE